MRALLLALALASPAAMAADVPADSLYQLQVPLTDSSGKPGTLDRYAGGPVLVTMFYGSCPHVCPMLIATIQRLERELPEANRGRLRVLMVSFDSKRDTPAKLTEVAQRHRVDLARWTLARADADDVRRLAAALNIQYRQLPDGEFSHATVITLLDPQGRLQKQTASLLRLDPEFAAALKAATAARP